MKNKPFLILGLLLLVICIACGGGDETTIKDEVSTKEEKKSLEVSVKGSSELQEKKDKSVVGSGAKSSGGVFNMLWSDPPTLDPHLTSDTTSAGIIVEIFGGLVAFDTDLNLVPDLAESWEISSDAQTYTFKIRDEAVFHDGKNVTAADFKWSFERAAHPDTASPVAETYLSDIVGVKEVLEGVTTDISGVTVIDEKTLQIEIDAPKAYFLAKLTYPTAYVLDKDNVEIEDSEWTDNPNGTGPFRLMEYKIGERLILEKHPNYHLGPAMLDRIQMNLAGGSSMAMYENDEIHITGVGMLDLERIKDPADPLNSQLVTASPSFSISYIGFNVTQPPFDDVLFRQALNHAIDKELIAKEVLADLVVPAYGILPPGFPGYNDSLEGLRFDPVLAKKLLSESNYFDIENRPRIVVTIPGTGGTPNLDLEVIINMWFENLGVEVEIQQVEWATYLQDLDKRKFQAYAGLGWQADYPDPEDFLDILFYSDSDNNHGAYSNPEVDGLLEKARVGDVQDRLNIYENVEEMIVNDAPWVPLWFGSDRYLLIKPYVKGYTIPPMTVPKMRHIYFAD
ncbi:MAG: ABC transporter substrate-binding protein [Chloroflexi bacterium]|nr:ABC transporter substrate-binding protein [Chloroflexota bacterium]